MNTLIECFLLWFVGLADVEHQRGNLGWQFFLFPHHNQVHVKVLLVLSAPAAAAVRHHHLLAYDGLGSRGEVVKSYLVVEKTLMIF